MTLSNYRFEKKIEKLVKDLEIVEDNVLDQHELDFKKALQQATFFYNIPLEEGKFDINKNFYQGQLMLIEEIVSAQEVVSASLGTLRPDKIDVDS